jgi:hypothetical protein
MHLALYSNLSTQYPLYDHSHVSKILELYKNLCIWFMSNSNPPGFPYFQFNYAGFLKSKLSLPA